MIVVYEIPKSGRGSGEGANQKWSKSYNVEGTLDESAARWAVLGFSPGTYDGLVRESVASIEPIGGGVWEVEISYAVRKDEPGDIEFSFELGGEQVLRTHSISTRNTYAAAGFTAPDFKGAINVRRSGNELSVQGVEVDAPTLSFSIKFKASPAVFTTAYRQQILAVKKAPVNNASFFGFAANEVRLLDASGGLKAGDPFADLTFKFKASPNETGLSVGDITGIAKKGWDYLWVYSLEEKDATAGLIVSKPKAVYVEQVYEESDFSLLGLS